ncbi:MULTISPECIES: hypothetical protein [Rhodobacterales]|uniref:hypothetical protein n=1 Tax=Rhodobacterales TaxID=204455 RepID=UPI003516056A
MKLPLILSVALALAACTPSGDDSPPPADRLAPDARAQCEAAGGQVMIAGLSGNEMCATRSPQAGESCSVASDCSSYCDADTRTCATYNYPFGCYAFLAEDGERVDICVD